MSPDPVTPEGRHPLRGIRVLDLGNYIAGPCTAVLLAEMGADVIKVEPPVGDPFRQWEGTSLSPSFVAFNRGKRSVCLDLKQPEDLDRFRALARTADVLVENFRAGVTERLGVGPDDLREENPRLIYCKISGFGTSGPGVRMPAYDGVATGYSGLAGLLLDPEEPRLRGPAIADAVTGHSAAFQILAALWAREASGKGAHVEITMLGSVVHFLHSAVAKWCVDGVEEGADLRTRLSMAFAFTTGDDRALIVHLSSPVKFWEAFCQVTGRPELLTDVRFAERAARVKNHEALRREMEPVFRTGTRDEWLRRLQDGGIPCAPVNSVGEAVNDPLYTRLGLLDVVEHEGLGPLPSILPPAHWDGETLGAVPRPPLLGEHTDEVLAGLAD